jgi:hypothetical protein
VVTQQTDTLQGSSWWEETQEKNWLDEEKTTLWEEKWLQPQVTFGICRGSSRGQESTAGLAYQ